MNVCYVGLCVVSCVVVWMVCECVLCGSVHLSRDYALWGMVGTSWSVPFSDCKLPISYLQKTNQQEGHGRDQQ